MSDLYYIYSNPVAVTYDNFNVPTEERLQNRYQEINTKVKQTIPDSPFKDGDLIVYKCSRIHTTWRGEVYKETIDMSIPANANNRKVCFALIDHAEAPSGYQLYYVEGASLGGQVIYWENQTQGTSGSSEGNDILSVIPWYYSPGEEAGARTLVFTTNIPIFQTRSLAQQYVAGQIDITNAINYHKFFDTITNQWVDTTPYTSGKIALVQNLQNAYDLDLVSEITIDVVRYSTNGTDWTETNALYWTNFISSDKHSIDNIEYYSAYFATNIPIFSDEAQTLDYFNGTIGIEEALNYNQISANIPKDVLLGESIDSLMNLNQTSLVGAFCGRYALNRTILAEMSNNFFNDDGSIVDRILDGLKLFGNKPIEAVIDLTYYPFDLTQYATSSPQNYIYFGSYKMDTTSGVYKIVNLNTIIDCGSVNYPVTYGNYRDYEPYTECYLYLPYCGMQKLDIAKYIGKTINIQYGVDITTGLCEAYILADGRLTDRFNGQMGVKQFLSSMDATQYASMLTNGLASSVGGMAAIGLGAGMILTGASATLPVLGAVNGIGAVVGGAGLYVMGMQKLGQGATGTQYQTSGGASSMLNQFDIQFPYFMFVYSETYLCDDVNIVGKPTNVSGSVGSFRGFLKCAEVDLKTTATYNENGMIEDLLRSGVYI